MNKFPAWSRSQEIPPDHWDDKANYLSTKKIDEDFGSKSRSNSIFLKVYDGNKNATETWKEENKDKLGEDIQLAP